MGGVAIRVIEGQISISRTIAASNCRLQLPPQPLSVGLLSVCRKDWKYHADLILEIKPDGTVSDVAVGFSQADAGTRDNVEALQAEVERLKGDLEALQKEVAELKKAPPRPAAAPHFSRRPAKHWQQVGHPP